MSPRFAVRSLAVLAALAAGGASACGVCIDDKVAAAYDHAVVTRAHEQGRVVVFAEPSMARDAPLAMRRVAERAGRVRGIDAATVRTSAAPAAISFVLDPRVASPDRALAALAAAAHVPGLRLHTLRILE